MTATDIPSGFEPYFRKSPFTDPWEPLYSTRTDKAVIIGLRLAVEPQVIKTGSTICFVQSLVKADDVVVARANATFRVAPKEG